MNTDLSPRRHTPLRLALTGAFGLVLLLLLFWTTSGANTLPNETPEFIRTFTPAYGLVRLAIALAAAATIGALFTLLGVGFYAVTKSPPNPSHRD